jgi:hypothetical protein
MWNPDTQAMNNKKVFSRKQLADIRARETTREALCQFSTMLFRRQREKEEKK